ncbi:Serine aminopeptidase S33 domain-containing protein [Pararobbsia alpina]|uniref:alpha/beta hydrolase family protein n=1 Tax=Pararobbsia alpina TaxID=621374 RepID=UPI0039A4861B
MTDNGAKDVQFRCRDSYVLQGHLWSSAESAHAAVVIVNPATGVLARYYHHLARFLVRHGFDVITYDYRGIGRSRPARLRGSGIQWRDWGELDFDAVIRWSCEHFPDSQHLVIGHSIGGFLPGMAESATAIDRMLTVGAQYAYFRDYAPRHRARQLVKWHVVMPILTLLCGRFPGRKLGWLEDLPAGVANEWAFRGADMESSYPSRDREPMLARFAAVSAPITALATRDDDFATLAAMRRTTRYYRSSDRTIAILDPDELGYTEIGHFGLFHSRHENDFWQGLLQWLQTGAHPWPSKIVERAPAEANSAEHPASASGVHASGTLDTSGTSMRPMSAPEKPDPDSAEISASPVPRRSQPAEPASPPACQARSD